MWLSFPSCNLEEIFPKATVKMTASQRCCAEGPQECLRETASCLADTVKMEEAMQRFGWASHHVERQDVSFRKEFIAAL